MKTYATGNHSHLRQRNLAGVMHCLYENAPISRIEISRRTQLNKTTVSSLVEELLTHQFIVEIGTEKNTGVGRNSVLLDLNPQHGYIISTEIGGDAIRVIVTDFAAEEIWSLTERSVPNEQTEAIDLILQDLSDAVEFARRKGNVIGVAVGVHGLVEKESGTIIYCPNSGWRDVPLASLITEKFGVPVVIDNEANLAALGEQFFGAAEGVASVLYISAGRGLGGGIVLEGEIYGGTSGVAGEFGHMTFQPDGVACNCGNFGCWETEVSHAAILRRMNAADGELPVSAILQRAKQGDAEMTATLAHVGRQLGIGMASLVNVFNPGLIVFGGELSVAADFMLPAARNEIEKRAMLPAQEKCQLVMARFASKAALMGGVAVVFKSALREIQTRPTPSAKRS